MAWTDQDVENWLADYPLPADFTWQGERAWPRYQLKQGYGQWLRTAGSYHPALRGLFRACCDLLQAIPTGAPLPTPDELAAQLRSFEAVQGTLGLGSETAEPKP
jgi:hypothetical protein